MPDTRMPRREHPTAIVLARVRICAGGVALAAVITVATYLPATAGALRALPVILAALAVAAASMRSMLVGSLATIGYLLILGYLTNRYDVQGWNGLGEAGWQLPVPRPDDGARLPLGARLTGRDGIGGG